MDVKQNDSTAYAGLGELFSLERPGSAVDRLLNCCSSSADSVARGANRNSGESTNLSLPQLSINSEKADKQPARVENPTALEGIPAPIISRELSLKDIKDWALEKSQHLTPDSVMSAAFLTRLRFYSLEESSGHFAKYKPFSHGAGLLGAWALYEDGKSLLNSKSNSERAYYGALSASDFAIASGAVLQNIPAMRTAGSMALGLGLTSRFLIPVGERVYQWGAAMLAH